MIAIAFFQDNVVPAMYSSSGQEQKMAQEVLTTLKEHPDAWQKVINHIIITRIVLFKR